jgi:sulfur relay (sulfurtransferase) DsrF/TusC family protein
MKALQVITQAFRTTAEEQDDAIVWLTRSMRSAGAELMVLLSGHAVQYAALTQRQPAFGVGDWQQTQPADLTSDLTRLLESDVPIYAVQEDLHERGLADHRLLDGITAIPRGELPGLYQRVDQVWQW